MNRIVVTGIGVISAIGNTVAENRASLIEGRCGISKLEMFPSKFSGSLPVAEVKISTAALKEKLNAHDPGVTRTTLLALHALQEALTCSHLTTEQISSFDTALIGGNTV
ncbi:MAG: beta-ketoacyl-[acyl-carrier-protein] synthase family protein, partial [Ferruginibacter sp.]|nr:beta-ketoacyl-[acyl-carrier-protein] synthase family protein [Ferruginibacter sp.]